MRIKALLGVLFAALLMLLPAPVFAQVTSLDMTALDKITAVEKVLYGTEQPGALVERTNKLEKDLYGLETKDTMITKVDRVYSYTKDNSPAAPSMLTRLNAAEWTLTHAVTVESAKTRIENLERILVGNSTTGSFDSRLTTLTRLAMTNGQVDTQLTPISKDTLIKIKMISSLDTRRTRAGDPLVFQAAEDVYAGGMLVIAKGALGSGTVLKVEQSKNFGRDAKMELTFNGILGLDGGTIDTVLGDKAKAETRSLVKAAGATVAGLVILGPIGLVGGAFIHGEDVTIPPGTEMYVQTKNETEVYGLKVK